MSLPIVTLVGKVVTDPELRFTASGAAVMNFRMVSAARKKNESTGQWEDGDTLWLDVNCWRNLAEHGAESLTKGDEVIVVGRLRTEEWEKDNVKHSKTALTADSLGVSLQWRTVPHSEKRAERTKSTPADDPWAVPPSDEPPPF